MDPLNGLSLFGVYISLFASTFFLYVFFENRKTTNPPEPKEWPSVTIAVPAYNDAATVGKTIESLLALDYPKDKLQLMAIENNNSTDGTYEVMKKYEEKGVEVFTIPQGGKGPALNFAIARARGDFFGGLDADSFVDPVALKKLMAHFTADDIAAVTPALKVYKPKSFLGRIQQVEYMMGVFLRRVFDCLDSIHVTPGPLTIYRKSFFEKYGGYDEKNITEDLEIAMRIQSKNMRIRNAIDANVYADNPETWGPLAKQRVRWYLGFIDNVIKYKQLLHPKYGILSMYVLPMAFISIFLAVFFSTYSLYRIGANLITYPYFLTAINFNLLEAFKEWAAQVIHRVPDVKTFLAIPLVIMSVSMLYLAKSYSKEKSHLGMFFILYVVAYIYIFSIWWIMTAGYKLFGGKLKFGGTIWDNSVLSSLRRRHAGN
jgi:cellulose synthase/poly-beta-1,6-N-acetylglucosamine synthase-like glycosyltransferase